MKSFSDYNKNNEEQKIGSSKIIVGKPTIGDKFVLVRDQFGLNSGSIVTIAEGLGEEHTVGFGLSKVTLNTSNGLITLTGSTRLIQECFDEYVHQEIKEEPKVVVVEKTIHQKIVEQGTPGQRGERGERGVIGPVGERGSRGEKGERGDIGPIGPSGSKGDIGPQGIQGERGPKGEKGEQGELGPAGKDGIDGKDGLPGPQGLKGERGEPGPEGKPGPAGATGKQGKKGEKGERGERGERGEKGERGSEGKQGKAGPKGLKGDKGDKGDPGDSGIVSANYPLVYDHDTRTLSFDSKKIEKLINTLSSSKGTFDLTSLGGGAVGIQFNKTQILKSVNDINFTGSGVNVIRKGKNVEVQISGGTGSGGSGISGPYVASIFGLTGIVGVTVAGNLLLSVTGPSNNTLRFYSKPQLTVKSPAGTLIFSDPTLPFEGDGPDINGNSGLKFNYLTDLSLETPAVFELGTLVQSSYLDLKNDAYLKFTDGTTQGSAALGFYYQSSAPSGVTQGDRWMDSDNGIEYVYINDGNNSLWVQPTNTGGSSTTSISILATTSVTGATYSALSSDYYIGVSYAGPVTITLPTNPETGREIVVKDESGNAGNGVNRQITIVGATASHKIDNQNSAIINLDNAGLHFIYRNGWRII